MKNLLIMNSIAFYIFVIQYLLLTKTVHLKILMEAGIITVSRRGTMNFYYLDPASSSLKLVAELWRDAEEMMDVCLAKVKERTENEII